MSVLGGPAQSVAAGPPIPVYVVSGSVYAPRVLTADEMASLGHI